MENEKYINSICTGCGACHSYADIEFECDEKGFPYPKLDGADLEKVSSLCSLKPYEEEGRQFKLWGEYDAVYEGYSKDAQLRYRASTGGILSEIAAYLLEKKMVDEIIHTAVSKTSPIGTETVVSATREEIINRCGSRYSISSPLMNFLQILEPGKKYAFIGKPCDVSALKRLIEKEPDLERQIVISMSFYCAGMPSNDANKELLEAMGCDLAKCVELKYRGDGWPGTTTAIDTMGQKHKIKYDISWGHYLGRDVRKVCRYCFDGIGEFADIVCADLWHLNEDNWPDFSEFEGRNIVFCRNKYSKKLVEDAAKNGNIHIGNYEDKMDSFHFVQPYQFERRTTMYSRVAAFRLFGRIVPKYNKSFMKAGEKYSTRKARFKVFAGTIKRLLLRKI